MDTSIPSTVAPGRRDTSFSICKAIAILCVVLSHAGGPGWLGAFVFQFHVPVFFICAGYFFNTRYLTDEKTYVRRRFTGLYLPFLRWSIFFLVIHNLLFPLGLLSETYGNAAGGVTHPYSWHVFCQRLWSIIFNMSGYDEFLCGAYWFFRALLLSSLGFLFLFKVIRHYYPKASDARIALSILSVCVLLCLWQTAEGLRMTGVGQGGYRELCGMAFMAIGFLYREYRSRIVLNGRYAAAAFALLVVGAAFVRSSMGSHHTLVQFLPLIPFALAGFVLVRWLSLCVDRQENFLRRALIYIGDRTLYVFAFHLLAFKVVSALKVAWYHLEWEQVGGHTVVNWHAADDLFFLLYLAVGVALPLGWTALYRHLEERYRFTLRYDRLFESDRLLIVCRHAHSALSYVIKFLCRLFRAVVLGLWHGIKSTIQGIRDIISASNPRDE